MLTNFRFIPLYYKLQLYFKHHLHCIIFTLHKGFMNIIWTQNFNFSWKTSEIYKFLIFWVFFMCIIVPYHYIKINIKSFVYYENEMPHCKTNNVPQNTYSTLKVLCLNQNSKSKDPMVQFWFFNIHIKHKAQPFMINMLLKGAPHRHLYIYAVLNMIWHGFWFIVSWFYCTLGLKVMKMPPRNTIHQGLSNHTKSTLQFAYKI
jgi:hypothetical protein